MKQKLILIIVGFVALFGTIAAAENISVSGYYKLFFTGFKMPVYRAGDQQVKEPPIGAVNNRLRLKISANPVSWMSLDAAYDISPRIQDPLLFQGDIYFSGIDPLTYRVDDFSERIYPGMDEAVSSFGIFHNLDRFMVTIKTAKADIFIGRQAIAWGSAHFINPTDIIAPFTFNQLDIEERRGVDAVRVRVPLGMMDELDFGYIAGKNMKFRNSAFYLRGKTYFLKTDVSAILMGFRENLMVGLDVTRSIGGAGAWVEAAYVVPDFFKKEQNEGGDNGDDGNYFGVSAGMDYNFNGDLYGFFEYHYNSAGKTRAADYAGMATTTAFTEGAVYLMARHYLNIGVTYQVTPLIPFNGMLIVNLTDGSFTLAPTLEYNIAENIYLSAGAYVGIGKKPGILPVLESPGFIRYHSEFGAYPSMVYTSFRIYF
jgi:hypothetical protein